jgi:type I restriction-modification system DNA methylase subunit
MSKVGTFQGKIIRIRDILRGASITGIDSMRSICIYIVARYMTLTRADIIGIPPEYAWENLFSDVSSGDANHALHLFYGGEGESSFVEQLDGLFGTSDIALFLRNAQVHKEIMKIMNTINIDRTKCKIDMLGWVYEQHLRTGSLVARDLGQFFTNRIVCKHMVKICDPHINEDGTLETVCDPTMGTGGFLTTIIHHYNAISRINWSEHIDAIHGCDADSKVAAIASMNMFMETKGIRANNVLARNSLYNGLPSQSYDVIVANPPFGLSGIEYDNCCDAIKSFNIYGTRSEPMFVQLIMASLAPGGRAAVIVPYPFLDSAECQIIDTRRILVEEFHLIRIIELIGKFFTNTNIPTAILFFENDDQNPTTTVTMTRIVRDHNSDDIHEEPICAIAREDIEQNNYSLNLQAYTLPPIIREAITPEEFGIAKRMFRIGAVCYLINGKPISKKMCTSQGLALIKSSNISSGRLIISKNQRYLSCDISHEYIKPLPGDTVITSVFDCGRCALVNSHEWVLSHRMYIIIRPRDRRGELRPMYLFWYLYSGCFYEMMQRVQRGITTKAIRIGDINDALIYVPSIEEQDTIIAEFTNISTRFNAMREQKIIIEQKMNQMQVDMRHRLNPLFNDDTVTGISFTNSKRKAFPHM